MMSIFSGFFTCSVYHSKFRSPFIPKEGTHRGCLVTKTHEYETKASIRAMFYKAIILIRNPEDSILSEFYRVTSGRNIKAAHVKFLPLASSF